MNSFHTIQLVNENHQNMHAVGELSGHIDPDESWDRHRAPANHATVAAAKPTDSHFPSRNILSHPH